MQRTLRAAMALLTPHLVQRAQRVNPYYQRRLGWPSPKPYQDIASGAFAYYVARFQHTERKGARRLLVDGILGPKTWYRMEHRDWQPPVADYLIVDEQRVNTTFPVVTYEHPEGLSFYGQAGWDLRREPSGKEINLLILHWDVCASAHECFHVLLERGLTAHLLLDGDGVIYQTLDLAAARAWHAREFNQRSIGVEIQNPAYPQSNKTLAPPRPVVTEQSPHTGEPTTHLDFYDIQKERVVQLVEVLCQAFAIPKKLPRDAHGEVERKLIDPGFTGVCGHYHVSPHKVDPGLTLWPLFPAYA